MVANFKTHKLVMVRWKFTGVKQYCYQPTFEIPQKQLI